MTEPRESGYVGWGGTHRWVTVDLNLGLGTHRGLPKNGLRRAVWDAAMGYVSGFRKRDILYYVLTRSLSHRVWLWAGAREGIEFRNGIPLARAGQARSNAVPNGDDR